jgi:hypothetical protein
MEEALQQPGSLVELLKEVLANLLGFLSQCDVGTTLQLCKAMRHATLPCLRILTVPQDQPGHRDPEALISLMQQA